MDTVQQTSLFQAEEGSTSIPTTPSVPTTGGKRARKTKEPLNGKQQLSATIKSVRDLLRKDAGLSGDTDRLPQLTWLLFLKNLDDFEKIQEAVLGDEYVPIVEQGFRWRDWVVDESLTAQRKGEELLKFVNDDLFPHLQRLGGQDNTDLREIVGTIFRGTFNRIRSGYILREVVDKLNQIDFTTTDEVHSVSHFYESMLKEMRDAAGDSGEFYTPRPVVRFIIDRLNPKLGEKVLDPACGTAGFLVEAYEHLKEQAETPEQFTALHTNLIGFEKKPTPYLLAIMNMLLHGINTPNITEQNTLTENIKTIREPDRVDVIATNPPFGGEEERGILSNFPDGMRTAETALLFFQYIMARLKRPGGRCGVVLPNGFLFGNGVASIIKKQLLTNYNLDTIVRLPVGTFAPYTGIATNILFFTACDHKEEFGESTPCTREVWYYELPLPEGRNSYSKTKPLQFEEFADCIAWWDNRVENEHAWKVSAKELLANDCNLDRKNPNTKSDFEHMAPADLVESIIEKEQRILEIMEEIQNILKTNG